MCIRDSVRVDRVEHVVPLHPQMVPGHQACLLRIRRLGLDLVELDPLYSFAVHLPGVQRRLEQHDVVFLPVLALFQVELPQEHPVAPVLQARFLRIECRPHRRALDLGDVAYMFGERQVYGNPRDGYQQRARGKLTMPGHTTDL